MNLNPLLQSAVGALGCELVAWERQGKSGLLRVFIDKTGGIGVEDCAAVSHHLTRVLAVEGVDYGRLEVSSPGLDRMLKHERDFTRFSGERARVKLRVAQDGQRNFIGILRAVRDGKLELEVDGKVLAFELDNLEKARLVPNV